MEALHTHALPAYGRFPLSRTAPPHRLEPGARLSRRRTRQSAKRALKVERSDDETKKLFKIALLRLGIAKGYTAKELEALFYFVDWVVAFSESKARNNFVGAVRTMAAKEEIHMPYVTSIEEVTREETMRAIAFKMLKAGESDDKILMYAEISPEELGKLKKSLRQETF